MSAAISSAVQTIEFHTSGSTGVPKTIIKTARQMQADATLLAQTFGATLSGASHWLHTVSRDHLYGCLWCNFLPQALDPSPRPQPIATPEELLLFAHPGANLVLITTPTFLETFLQREEAAQANGAFRALITSGALLKAPLARRIRTTLGICPLEILGSTETGSVAWRKQEDSPLWNLFETISSGQTPDGRLVVDSPFCIKRPYVMADAVAFESPRQFHLLGRTDRCVKIHEHLIALQTIEQALEQHPLVAEAHAVASDKAIPRIWTLVRLTPEGKSRLRHSTYAALIREINQSLPSTLPACARPRRMRFVEDFPRNAQGKLPREAALDILEGPQEPVAELLNKAADELSIELTWPPDALCFQGHFPGLPVLPGVIQLNTVQRLIERHFHLPPFSGTISRLKFSAPIGPGQTIACHIRKLSATRFEFTLSHPTKTAASGRLEFAL